MGGNPITLFDKSYKYKLKIDDDGKIYFECRIDGEDEIIDFDKNDKGEYYLDFQNYRLWMNEVKKEKKTESPKVKVAKISQSEINEEEQSEQGDVIENEIVVGINDKIYFYSNPNFEDKTKAYFVKGQTAEYDYNADNNVDDDFLFVNFAHNGKVKSGYISRSDIEFK